MVGIWVHVCMHYTSTCIHTTQRINVKVYFCFHFTFSAFFLLFATFTHIRTRQLIKDVFKKPWICRKQKHCCLRTWQKTWWWKIGYNSAWNPRISTRFSLHTSRKSLISPNLHFHKLYKQTKDIAIMELYLVRMYLGLVHPEKAYHHHEKYTEYYKRKYLLKRDEG